MAPRNKYFKKKSAKKSKGSTSSATTSTTTSSNTTEQSFINNFQIACTSSPNRNDFPMFKSLSDFNSIVEICNCKLKKRRDMMITNLQNKVKSIINKIDMFTMSIIPEVGNSLVGECIFWQVSMLGDATKEGARLEDSSDMRTLTFERPTRAQQLVADILKRRKERTTSKSKSQKRNPLPSQFQTPDNPLLKSGTKSITPKVDLSKPLSVRRRPKQGEMAVSLTGSPLLVSSVMHDEFASVNVPLPDGKILAILPQTFGFEPDDIPHLDSKTRQQLETLKSHLQVFCDHGTVTRTTFNLKHFKS